MTDQSTPTPDHLVIRGLRVAPVAHPEHEILQGIDLTVGQGEVHAIMGPNGSGKTTLAYALMGHPAYVIKGGEVLWKGRDILGSQPGQARPPRPVPRLPVPDRDPRPERRELHPQRAQRQAPGHRQGSRDRPDRPDAGRHHDARLPQQDAREDGAPAHGRRVRDALRQRGLLRRREEAPRDAPDGRPRAARWRSSTRPTPASTSTRCASSPRASTRCSTRTSASCSSPTTSACSTTSSLTSSTSWPRAGS